MLRELYARLEICSTIRTDLCHEYQKAAKGYEKLSLNEAAAAKFEGGAAGLLKKASLSTEHIGPTPKPLPNCPLPCYCRFSCLAGERVQLTATARGARTPGGDVHAADASGEGEQAA